MGIDGINLLINDIFEENRENFLILGLSGKDIEVLQENFLVGYRHNQRSNKSVTGEIMRIDIKSKIEIEYQLKEINPKIRRIDPEITTINPKLMRMILTMYRNTERIFQNAQECYRRCAIRPVPTYQECIRNC